MSAQPIVSVVIGAYNAMPYFTQTLESVASQSLGLDRLEIVIVDDGSTDDTLAEARRFADAYPTAVRVFTQENSGSPAAPRNKGIDEARGRFVFFLDADDYLGPEALKRMLTIAEENGTDVVIGRLVGVNGRRVPAAPFVDGDLPRTDAFSCEAFSSLGPMKLIRRSLIDRLGVRFPLGLPSREEHVVMASLMLHAEAISVLASYDCIYVVKRDDGGGVTKNLRSRWPKRLTATETVIDEILGVVEAGPRQDILLARFACFDLLRDAATFSQNRQRFKKPDRIRRQILALLDKVSTPGVMRRMTYADRLDWWLFRRGQYDRFVRLTRYLRRRNPDRLLEGGVRRR
jgi:poly(ribitol-phosphate) beta-N-acetylglucosaminyltransferase